MFILIAKVNLSPMILESSVGVLAEIFIDLTKISQGFPTICLATASKQNISVLVVPSVA
jgi:hypothetical protein